MKKILAALSALTLLVTAAGCSSQESDSDSEIVFSDLGDVTHAETEAPVTLTDEQGAVVTDEDGNVVTSIPIVTPPPEESVTDAPSDSLPTVTTSAPKQTGGNSVTVSTSAPPVKETSVTPTQTTPPPVKIDPPTGGTVQPVPENATEIILGSSVTINGEGASADGSHVLITKAGKYCITGKLTNGQIEVNSLDKVHLYFNNMSVTNSAGPAVLVTNAQRIKLTLMDGTINSIEDGGTDKTNNGAFFTNDTLEVKGEGTLYIKGNNREGIASDDDIIIESGNIYIQSFDDGLNANDDITIMGGYVYIAAGGDGIDSKGTTNIEGGTVIVAGTGSLESAVESDGIFTMTGGTFIGVGGAGLLKTPATSSAQYTALFKYQTMKSAGTLLRMVCGSSPLATFSPASDYCALTISSPSITANSQCTLFSGGTCTGSAKDGLYEGGTYSGGSDLGTFTVSSKVSGFNVQ